MRSNGADVTQAIPQRSVIGCILFIIYINDLPGALDSISIIFADDLSLAFPCTKGTDWNMKISNILNAINCWLNDHNLVINYTKTKIIQFTRDTRGHTRGLHCI